MIRKQLVKKLLKDHVYTLKVCVILDNGEQIDVHKVRDIIFDSIIDQEETRPARGKWKRKKHTYVRYVHGKDTGGMWNFPGLQSNMPIKNILKVWHKGHCRDFVDAESAQEWREKHLAISVAELGWLFIGADDWLTNTSVLNVEEK